MWIDDQVLQLCHQPLVIECFVPDQRVVVLGAGNQAETEVFTDRCRTEGVPVLKRYGGGGTVLLGSECLVVTVGAWVRQHFQNKHYFGLLNAALIETMEGCWPELHPLRQDGLSDIVWGDRKIVGSSLFRSRNYLLFQASVLVDPDFDAIERLLRHPSREPEYRKSRRHADFLSGIGLITGERDAARCCSLVGGRLTAVLRRHLADELTDPVTEQIPNLLKRVNRSDQGADA